MSVVALVPAAGRGERLGAQTPKALVPVLGEPLLVRSVRGLLQSGRVRHVVVAAPADQLGTVREALAELGPRVHLVAGGAERIDSVRRALDSAVSAVPEVRTVLVHDAARAFTPPAVTRAVVGAVEAGAPAVVPVLPVTDTVKHVDTAGVVDATIDRSSLRTVQTPQGFDAAVLRRAHTAATEGNAVGATDDAGLVEALGDPVHTVPGHPYSLKITTPYDLAVAEAVLAHAGVDALDPSE